MNLLQDAQKQLNEVIVESLGRAVAGGKLPAEPIPAFRIEVPGDTSHGDFAANVAMVSARAFKLPPRKIAEIIASELNLENTYFEKCEIAGPGFMNYFVSQKWIGDAVKGVLLLP